ncbi:MAG: hypothetical protein RL279_21 [Pseudomonadota bacterium]|jgi:hypothetical protein
MSYAYKKHQYTPIICKKIVKFSIFFKYPRLCAEKY